MTIRYKKIISTLAIFVVAVLTGFAVGRIYLDSTKGGADSSKTYAELVLTDSQMSALYEQSKGQDVTAFTGVELWQIAEYNLLKQQKFTKVMLGDIDSTGQHLILRSVKQRDGETYSYEKVSPSKTVVGIKTPEVCSKIVYDYKSQSSNISFGKITTTGPESKDLRAEFPAGGERYTATTYKEKFRALPPQTCMPYIFTNKTVGAGDVSGVTANEDGTYTFTIKLTGHDNIKDAALCYTQEIYFTCGYGEPSLKWKNVEVTVKVKKVGTEILFDSVRYFEEYEISSKDIPIGAANIKDDFRETFEYSEVA